MPAEEVGTLACNISIYFPEMSIKSLYFTFNLQALTVS
jgi:hypothetical protein